LRLWCRWVVAHPAHGHASTGRVVLGCVDDAQTGAGRCDGDARAVTRARSDGGVGGDRRSAKRDATRGRRAADGPHDACHHGRSEPLSPHWRPAAATACAWRRAWPPAASPPRGPPPPQMQQTAPPRPMSGGDATCHASNLWQLPRRQVAGGLGTSSGGGFTAGTAAEAPTPPSHCSGCGRGCGCGCSAAVVGSLRVGLSAACGPQRALTN